MTQRALPAVGQLGALRGYWRDVTWDLDSRGRRFVLADSALPDLRRALPEAVHAALCRREFAAGRAVYRHNDTVTPHHRLLLALLRGSPYTAGNWWHAMGTGLASWDVTPPTFDPDRETLTTEVFRKQPESVLFLDDWLGSPVADVAAAVVLRVHTRLEKAEANGNTLREHGLASGDASATADTGVLVDHVVHDGRDKDSGFGMDRYIELGFTTPPPAP